METQTKPRLRTYTRILRELSQEEAEALRPKPATADEPAITVADILYVPFDTTIDGKVLESPEMLTVTEWQDYAGGYRVTKFPAGSMNFEDTDIYGAADRELFTETGHVAEGGWDFIRAVETTSTRHNERHFKVYVGAKGAIKRGEPSEKCIESVNRVAIKNAQDKNPNGVLLHMTYDQGIGFRQFVEKQTYVNMNYASRLMNIRVYDWTPKG